MPLIVNEDPSNAPGSGIEVFVRTPNGKVDVPIMQAKRNVADGVRQIPPYYCSLFGILVSYLDIEYRVMQKKRAFRCPAVVIASIGNHWPV